MNELSTFATTQPPIENNTDQNLNLKETLKANEERLKVLLDDDKEFEIPTFHLQVPEPDDKILLRIREKARHISILSKTIYLTEHDELEAFYGALEKYSTPPYGGRGTVYIAYKDYKYLVAKLSEKFKKLFNATVYLQLLNPDDPYGRIEITALFNYAMRKIWLKRTRIEFDRFDFDGNGLIHDTGLEEFVYNLVPTKPSLAKINPKFLPYYICNIVRKFMFFLDPNKTGKVKILDILTCGYLDDLFEVTDEGSTSLTNWFSYESAKRVYRNFLAMDVDRRGTLTRGELQNFMKGQIYFIPTFIDRIFEELLTYSGHMDYMTYLELVLALDHPKEQRSVDYFFRLLDVFHQGYLDALTLKYFFKDMVDISNRERGWAISFENFKDEIFDMVKPEDPLKITVKDLVKSGCAFTVFTVLIDFIAFAYNLSK